MKKLNNNGFVLAETLIVTVFLMVLFTMLYSNYYPLIGEFEKRESYDDVDGKYAAYWIKKLIEDKSYIPSEAALKNLENYGFMRFSCLDVSQDDESRDTCMNMLEALEIANCNTRKTSCDVFITYYRIGGTNPDFKDVVKNGISINSSDKKSMKKYQENCSGQTDAACLSQYVSNCKRRDLSQVCAEIPDDSECEETCIKEGKKNVFRDGMKDYVATLPNYSTQSLNYARLRVIISSHHTKDNNNFYSYSTIEVNK